MTKRIFQLLCLFAITFPCKASEQEGFDIASLFFYLLEHTEFTDNQHAGKQLNLCFYEDYQQQYARQLDGANKVNLQGRSVHIISLYNTDEIASRKCSLLFIDQQNEQEQDLFKQLQQHHNTTLTVGETDNFVKQGGLVAIVIRSGKMKLLVNMHELQQSSLKISSKLLKMAILYQ